MVRQDNAEAAPHVGAFFIHGRKKSKDWLVAFTRTSESLLIATAAGLLGLQPVARASGSNAMSRYTRFIFANSPRR